MRTFSTLTAVLMALAWPAVPAVAGRVDGVGLGKGSLCFHNEDLLPSPLAFTNNLPFEQFVAGQTYRVTAWCKTNEGVPESVLHVNGKHAQSEFARGTREAWPKLLSFSRPLLGPSQPAQDVMLDDNHSFTGRSR